MSENEFELWFNKFSKQMAFMKDDKTKCRAAWLACQRAAQSSGQAEVCLCTELKNFTPDAVPNPDCPLHGAGIRS